MTPGSPLERSPELRRRLLDASPEELAELVRQQPELSEVVERILSVNREVAAALDGEEPPVRQEAGRRGRVAARSEAPARAAAGVRPWSWPLVASLGVAAAAAVGWLMVGSDGVEPGGGPERASPTGGPLGEATPLSADLAVEAGSDFAVFPTDDPDMAVVWIFDNGAD